MEKLTDGKEMIVARSGWSHQMCYEVYVDGSSTDKTCGINFLVW